MPLGVYRMRIAIAYSLVGDCVTLRLTDEGGELDDRAPVSDRRLGAELLLDDGAGQLRRGIAVRKAQDEIGTDEAMLVEAGQRLQRGRRGLLREERHVRIRAAERVGCRELADLRRAAEENGRLNAERVRDQRLERSCRGLRRLEDDVAACDQRPYVAVARLVQDAAQLGHRHLVT